MTLKVGTIVKIRPDSEYFGQSDTAGKIKSIEHIDEKGDRWYSVKFDDGTCDFYRDYDLHIIKRNKIPIREEDLIL